MDGNDSRRRPVQEIAGFRVALDLLCALFMSILCLFLNNYFLERYQDPQLLEAEFPGNILDIRKSEISSGLRVERK